MVQQAVTSDTLPPTADAPVCDQKGCNEAATLAYRWEWGATGVVCAKHGQLLQQKSEGLGRKVVLHPIQAAPPPSLTRDERVQLTARALVLEDELKAAHSSIEKLDARVKDQALQLSAAVTKQRELTAQLKDASVKLSQAEARAEQLSATNGELLVELERLQHLDQIVTERQASEAHERGIEGGNVVDG